MEHQTKPTIMILGSKYLANPEIDNRLQLAQRPLN